MVELWRRAAPTYESVVPYFTLMGERVVDYADLAPGEEVLDVACGKGATLLPAGRAVGPDGRAVGVDIVPEMVAAARMAAAEAGLTNVEVLEMDAEHLDFGDGSFDTVICAFALAFFGDAAAAMREFRRVLRDDGRFVASAPTGGGDEWIFFGRLCEEFGLRSNTQPSVWVASPESYAALAADVGLPVVAVRNDEIVTSFPDNEAWWSWAWSHGQRSYLERLPAERVDDFKAAAFAALDDIAAPDGSIPLTQQFTVVMSAASRS